MFHFFWVEGGGGSHKHYFIIIYILELTELTFSHHYVKIFDDHDCAKFNWKIVSMF